MPKNILLKLGLVLMLLLGGCSDSTELEEPQNQDDTEIGEPDQKDKEPIVDNKDTDVDKQEPLEFEELVVIDNDSVTIIISDIEPDNMWGYTLKVFLENKLTDKDIMVSLDHTAVNGIQTEPLFASKVDRAKKSTDEINFIDSDLKNALNDEFRKIELTFKVYDYDDWMADDIAYETITIYPLGEQAASTYQREALDTDLVLVENEDALVIVTDIEEDGLFGFSVNLYLLNKSDKEIMFSADGVSVNGFMADPFWAKSLKSSYSGFSQMWWSESTLEENGIEEVNEIEMTFSMSDANDWLAPDIFSDKIILSP